MAALDVLLVIAPASSINASGGDPLRPQRRGENPTRSRLRGKSGESLWSLAPCWEGADDKKR
jgi:hypothetical protein